MVYRASQEQPIRRTVALKLIQLGMATREVIARFESERQALAVLDHPNIAKVFDAGANDQGRPYFVMELVEGVAITQFCDEHKLSTRQRLELFMGVCRAVHHAHQKGIIHRDLKPTNVLVAEHDGEPVPKVIDFGVARAVDHRQRGHTALTQLGGFLGTPEYMSPEQAEMSLDVDIRTDVYSLGVLLYELLVGRLPFDSESLRGGTPERLEQLLRGTDITPPSTKVGTLGEAVQAIAAQRQTQPSSLRQELRGDLDWIVMRALEKDRERRYGTASELGNDIGRHLRDEPVVAGPPGVGYRVGKFVKRNWIGVAVVASAAILLLSFAVVTSWQAAQLRRALDQSEREALKSAEVTTFLTDLFQISDPSTARGNSILAREILDRGAQRLETELDGQPEVQAAMMGTIGEIYIHLGLLPEAENLIIGGLELQQQTLDPLHPNIAASHDRLSYLRQWQGQYAAAEEEARRALALRRAITGGGDESEARGAFQLGRVLRLSGRYQEAETALRQAMAVWERVASSNDPEPMTTLNELGMTLSRLGRFEEARAMHQQTIDHGRRTLGADHPDVATRKLNLASVLSELGRDGESEVLLREVVTSRRRVFGDEHILLAASMNNLARICQRLGKRAEAESLHRQVLEMRRRLQGSEHPDVASAMTNLGVVLRQNGRYTEAENLYREALTINQRNLGPDHREVAIGHHNLSSLLRRLGRLTEAESEIRQAVEILRRTLDDRHPHVARSQAALGKILVMAGKLDEAETVLRGAETVQAEALPAGHWRALQTRMYLGECLTGGGRYQEAEPVLLAALTGLTAARGEDHDETRAAMAALANLYDAWDRPEDAGRYRAQLAALDAPAE